MHIGYIKLPSFSTHVVRILKYILLYKLTATWVKLSLLKSYKCRICHLGDLILGHVEVHTRGHNPNKNTHFSLSVSLLIPI